MKQALLTIGCLLALSPALRAQDKIHTTDGQTIECRIIDLSREDKNIVYQTPADGDSTRQFIRPNTVEYIERDGKKWAKNVFNEFEPLQIRRTKAPELHNMYGLSGVYTSSFWGISANYAHFFNKHHGLTVELMYQKPRPVPDLGIALMPHYEYHIFIHKMRSFFFAKAGVGVGYYKTTAWAILPPRELVDFKTVTLSAGIKLGFDIRLQRGLYLNVAGLVHCHIAANDVGKRNRPFTMCPEDSYGISLGLRFGREQ